jgi:hypothetical protein
MRPGSCARTTGARSNDTAAALPISVMNSRRLWLPSRAGDLAKYVELYHTIFLNEPGGVVTASLAPHVSLRVNVRDGSKHEVAARQPAAREQEPRGR